MNKRTPKTVKPQSPDDPPPDPAILTAGRHKGRHVKDVPTDYLLWTLRKVKLKEATFKAAAIEYFSRRAGRPLTWEETGEMIAKEADRAFAMLESALQGRLDREGVARQSSPGRYEDFLNARDEARRRKRAAGEG